MSRALLRLLTPGLTLVALTLSACSAGSLGGGSSSSAVGPSGTAADQRATLATQAACRDQVNQMYEIRDRAEIYSPNPSVNTPFSANYQPDVPSRGLSQQFGYDQARADCEHSAATGGTDAPPPPATGR